MTVIAPAPYAVMGCDRAGVPWVVSTHATAREAVEKADTLQAESSRFLVYYPANMDDPESSPRSEVEAEDDAAWEELYTASEALDPERVQFEGDYYKEEQ